MSKRRVRAWAKTPDAIDLGKRFHEALAEAHQKYPLQLLPSKAEFNAGLARDHMWQTLLTEMMSLEMELNAQSISYYVTRLDELRTTLNARVQAIDALLAQLDRLTVEKQEAQVQQAAIGANYARLLDYEQRINKSLYEAIDRLEAIKQARQDAGSMGSFVKSGETK
ncbi:MAG: hypothetical protein NW220_09020 [Leptolyngbyaceae cyanobacterium bins.349]|nr:hypothetical protein [Leptolyngbyaceae cyanobacterium bins.349]